MRKILSLASSVAALSSIAVAQCPIGPTAGLVKWSSAAGFTSGFAIDDESITSPPILLPSPFPMAGAVGNLDTLWVSSNGHVYLSDSTLGLTQPAGGALYGMDADAEMRGAANSSPRVAFCGDDQQGSNVAGATWSVTVDTTQPGEVRITWFDMRRYANTTDRYSFSGRLFLSGHPFAGGMESTFGTLPADIRYVGISIGNNVAPTAVSSDLTASPNSGTDGILFEAFTAATWDLNQQSVTIVPNGTGGYVSVVGPNVSPCAIAATYGTGCYSLPGDNTMFELFPDAASAKAALDGNSLSFLRTPTGYVAVWNGATGPAFVPPGGGATTLTFAAPDDGNVAFTPSAPIPVPNGTAATWNCSVNGILTANPLPNNAGDWTPTVADFTSATLAPYTGFCSWTDLSLVDSVPNGTITTEEVSGVLYVSWNAVESYDYGVVNPVTFQYQVNMATGDVTIVWVSWDPSTNTRDTMVGCTLAGAGATPGAVTLSTTPPVTLFAIDPLTLSVSGRPVITGGGAGPSQVITITANGVPDAAPPFGIALGFLIFSLNAIPGGIDLGPAGVDVGMPGCNAYILTFDVLLGFPSTQVGSQIVFNSAIPQPLSPGLNFYAQALALFPPNSLPGGLNNFGGLMSNGVQLRFDLN